MVWDGIDGLLSPPLDADALGRHLVAVLNDTGLGARIAEFSSERIVERTIEVYRDALYSSRC